jgi:hypothetical protein
LFLGFLLLVVYFFDCFGVVVLFFLFVL